MKHIRLLSLFLIFIPSFFALTSCESSDETTLSSAQSCLDQANQSTANACVAQLGTLRSAEAYSIICSAHFVSQGFTTTRFVSAYNALSTSGSGTNPTATAMSVMAFDQVSGANGSAQTLSDCQASNVHSLIQLAVLAQLATLVGSTIPPGSYSSTSGYTPAQIATAITNFVANGGSPASLGTTAVTAGQVYCAAGSSFATSSVCTTLNGAITNKTDPTAIGNALLAQLQIANP